MCFKLLYEPIIAIKTPLKLLLLGVFIIFGLLFTNEAIFGAGLLNTGFEELNLGTLTNQYPFDSLSSQMFVVDEFSHSGNKSAKATNLNGRFRTATTTTLYQGIWEGWIYYVDYQDWNNQGLCLNRNDANLWCIVITKDGNNLTAGEFELELNTWLNFEIVWNNGYVKYSFDGGLNYSDEVYVGGIASGVNQLFSYGNALRYVYFDDLGGSNCSLFNAWNTCENAGCCWYYSNWLQQNFCVECPSGECGATPYDCGSCLIEETCEAVSFCYWFEGFCKFGTGICSEGLGLQFCENQSECEGVGGYWYDDYCWLSPKPSIINWQDYYDEYGDYATPSVWISNVASTTASFFQNIGGFLTTFKNNFDIKEAYQKGSDFGSAIPIARGYLGILNDFVGGLPFGEFFVFILIFMLAIGVFRIVRNLIQVLKFW